MAYKLNVDLWQWVDPETQKVTNLKRGDEVPQKVLDSEGIDLDALTVGHNPVFLKGDEDAGRPLVTADTGTQARQASPQVTENKK